MTFTTQCRLLVCAKNGMTQMLLLTDEMIY